MPSIDKGHKAPYALCQLLYLCQYLFLNINLWRFMSHLCQVTL